MTTHDAIKTLEQMRDEAAIQSNDRILSAGRLTAHSETMHKRECALTQAIDALKVVEWLEKNYGNVQKLKLETGDTWALVNGANMTTARIAPTLSELAAKLKESP